MERRHEIYNETVNYVEAQAALGRVLLLRPESPLPVKRISRDPEQLQRTYELGRMMAEKHIEAIQAFLGRTGGSVSSFQSHD